MARDSDNTSLESLLLFGVWLWGRDYGEHFSQVLI
jgi:hypothetical protein